MTDVKNTHQLLSWKIHMAKRNPTRAVAVLILIFICAYFIHFTMEDLFFTIVALFVLLIMVLPYYLPTSFILTDEGVEKNMLFSKQKRSWSEFSRYSVEKNVIKLFTMKKESRLDNYRSLLIICNKNKDEVIAVVKEKTKAETKVDESIS